MKLRKRDSFVLGLLSLLGLFVLTVFAAPGSLTAIGPAVVVAIPVLCGAYQGTNVADNYQHARWYNPDMDPTRRGEGE